jgi:hypothetical protein
MGDRAQLKITNGQQSFYLYTHWKGSMLPETVQAGLREAGNHGRHVSVDGDWTYGLANLVRVFTENCHESTQGTGMGIGFKPEDNDGGDRILVLDLKDWTVAKYRSPIKVPIEKFAQSLNPSDEVNWK